MAHTVTAGLNHKLLLHYLPFDCDASVTDKPQSHVFENLLTHKVTYLCVDVVTAWISILAVFKKKQS